jgi:curved DNA-binding protein CbpA
MDLIKCFQILDVSQGCTWEELRTAYRRQVQKHHPDRFHQQLDQQKIAKERMLELNKAFHILEEFYKKNGYLPYNVLKRRPTKSDQERNPEQTRANQTDTSSYTKSDIKPSKDKQAVRKTSWSLVMIIAVLGYYFFWSTPPQRENPYSTSPFNNHVEKTDNSKISDQRGDLQNRLPDKVDSTTTQTDPQIYRNSTPPVELAPLGMQGKIHEGPFFTYGDTSGKVFEVQGIPTRTVGDIWFYGTSEVHFNKGVVVSWYSSPNHPLKVLD